MSAELTRAYGQLFDAKRKVFLGAGAVLVCLKNDTEKARLTSAWTAEFEGDAALKSVVVARNDDVFNALANESPQFVVLNSSRVALNNQVLTVDGDAGRTAGDGIYWRFFVKKAGRRYVPPVTP